MSLPSQTAKASTVGPFGIQHAVVKQSTNHVYEICNLEIYKMGIKCVCHLFQASVWDQR